ncbi:hypothetical protein NMG60_11003993 [Bertholletia excelsa]
MPPWPPKPAATYSPSLSLPSLPLKRLNLCAPYIHKRNLQQSSFEAATLMASSPNKLIPFILSFFLVLLQHYTFAAQRKTFIVRVQYDAKPSIFPTHKHWYDSSLRSLAPPQIRSRPVESSIYMTPFSMDSLQSSHLSRPSTSKRSLA